MGVTFIYFSQTAELDKELEQRMYALNEFRKTRVHFNASKNRYKDLVSSITKKTQNLRLKSFFEKKMKEEQIDYRGLETRELESDPTNIIFEQIKEHEIDIRISKISIPKILNFIIKIEKSQHLISVKDLKIVGIYGTKLFFDLDIVFRSYQNS